MKPLAFVFILFALVSFTFEQDIEAGWIPLFNGKDLNYWKVKIKDHALHKNVGNTFRIVDGNLRVS